jgi:hypothetical protein
MKIKKEIDMDLRDWFAGQVASSVNASVDDPPTFARYCYRLADALLTERKKSQCR